jgi:hypothetical protein
VLHGRIDDAEQLHGRLRRSETACGNGRGSDEGLPVDDDGHIDGSSG